MAGLDPATQRRRVRGANDSCAAHPRFARLLSDSVNGGVAAIDRGRLLGARLREHDGIN